MKEKGLPAVLFIILGDSKMRSHFLAVTLHLLSMLYCYINNQFLPFEEAGIPVNDLGFQRGYGIFDFLRVAGNTPLFMEDHLERFFHSAKEMRLQVPLSKQGLIAIIAELLQRNGLPHSGVRIMLSGGISKDGYEIVAPNLVITQQPLMPPGDVLATVGYKLFTYPYRRQMPEIKTTDYLMAIWLQPWLKEKRGDDILYQQDGLVSECPRSNFFIVTEEGTVVTPAMHILKGISRKQVLKAAVMNGIKIEERDVSLEDIRHAKEAFITSSTKRVIPVGLVDDIVFKINEKSSVTGRLFDLFLEHERSFQRIV